jgi:tRNA threonylcarbamoyl adenosine modification protein YeaZ
MMTNVNTSFQGAAMITLAFDTALDKMYVVLRRNGKTVQSKIVETTQSRYHSAELIPTIQEVLRESNFVPQDIDLIAVNIGPGSFTGIRACVTVARTMAQQLGCKVEGVSSLEILSKLNPTDQPTIVVMDARKNCAYVWCDGEISLKPMDKIDTQGYFVITDETYKTETHPLGEILAQIAEARGGAHWRELKPLYIQPPSIHGK